MTKGARVAKVLGIVASAVIMSGCLGELRAARQVLGLANDTAKLAQAVRPKRARRPPLSPELRAAVAEARKLAKLPHKTPAQELREAELNALFERDMRQRDGLRPVWPGR